MQLGSLSGSYSNGARPEPEHESEASAFAAALAMTEGCDGRLLGLSAFGPFKSAAAAATAAATSWFRLCLCLGKHHFALHAM